MKKLKVNIDVMQNLRDNGVSTRTIGKSFKCSASFVCRNTTYNPDAIDKNKNEAAARKTKKILEERAMIEKENAMAFIPKNLTGQDWLNAVEDEELKAIYEAIISNGIEFAISTFKISSSTAYRYRRRLKAKGVIEIKARKERNAKEEKPKQASRVLKSVPSGFKVPSRVMGW